MSGKKVFSGIIISIIFLFAIVYLLFNQYKQWGKLEGDSTSFEVTNHNERPIELTMKEYETKATIAAIGDILLHHTVYEDAYNGSRYDFAPMFSSIESHLQQPDFLIANQESMPGGVELGLSSYPTFNSPKEVVSTLQNVGIDAVTNANNHSLDKGIRGIESAIEYYDTIGMPYTGAFKSPEDQERIRTFQVNGISFALLAYTYGTNGIPLPEGKEYAVNLMDTDIMIDDIQRAKKLGVDLVVLSVHWGNEYERYPTNEQKQLAKTVTEAGADIIFGHHPHVLQPIEKWALKDGREAVVVYSLGNFLSGQKEDYKDIGGIVTVEVVKKGNTIHYPAITFEPTFVKEDRYQNYHIYPLQQAFEHNFIKHSKKDLVSHMTHSLEINE